MIDISRDICIKCNACSTVCPTGIILVGEDGYPDISGTACIKCSQCEAVCPSGALVNNNLPQDNILEIKNYPPLSAEQAELFLRSRRSIRHWKNKPVSNEEIEKLVNIGRYAPTGSNTQNVSYIVVSSPDKMEEVRNLTMDFYKNSPEKMHQALYQRFANPAHDGYDLLFRNAPMLIIGCADKNLAKSDSYASSAQFALTYIELFAPSLGLGTCYAGYFNNYLRTQCPKLLELLGARPDQLATDALLFGRPEFRYFRTASRNPLDNRII